MHWYKNNQRYYQTNKDGSQAKRVLVERAIAEGACPGVTDILDIASSSFWMPEYFGNLGIKAAMETHPVDEATATAWDKLAFERFAELRDAPADRGSEIHELAHRINNGEEVGPEGDKLKKTIEYANQMAKINLACMCATAGFNEVNTEQFAEVCFSTDDGYETSHGMLYGGTPDYVVCAKDKDGIPVGVYVLDYKTIAKPRKPYIKELGQLAAYTQFFREKWNIEIYGAANVYINNETHKLCGDPWEWTAKELDKGFDLFAAAYDTFNRGQYITRMIAERKA